MKKSPCPDNTEAQFIKSSRNKTENKVIFIVTADKEHLLATLQ